MDAPETLTHRLRALDDALITAVRPIRVLGTLSWPEAVIDRFLESVAAGSPGLPVVEAPVVNLDDQKRALEALLIELRPEDHALERYLADTALSWLRTTEMLTSAGTPAFTAHGLALYGSPTEAVHPGAPTHLDVARTFLAQTEGFRPDFTSPTLDSEAAAEWIRARLADTLPDLPVVLDPDMAARATAGSKRVRLRANTTYTEAELGQLLQHEALVHSATARNGHDQPVLKTLGYGAPRTTATQEGLATFAELITDTMAVRRLRRISLRIVALEAALRGADFVEVFRLFLEHGQEPEAAARSAARIFRGGDVRGRVVFPKDVVYLRGTLLTHAFLLKAEQVGRGDLARTLFVGRLTWGDAVRLQPWVGSVLSPPAILPAWAARDDQLCAYLTWSALHRSFDLDRLTLDGFTD